MKKLYATLLIGLFSLPVLADERSTDAVLSALEVGGIQYVYATPAEKLTILRTKATTERVDAVVESGALDGLSVEIVDLVESFDRDAGDL
jgi:hypothetical protein